MRVISKDRSELIEALVAEADIGRVTAGLLEKDEHLKDALRAPLDVLGKALIEVGVDDQSRIEYEQNLLPLVYGSFKPHFEEAFTSFDKVARTLFGTVS